MWTDHGSRTDQFKKMAASPSNVTSVTMALPLVKIIPPRAGSRANASGDECHTDGSWLRSGRDLGFGSRRSSVDERIEFRASSREKSDSMELLRRSREPDISAKVEARPRAR